MTVAPSTLPKLQAALAPRAAAAGAHAACFTLPATRRPWTATGIAVRRGQAYTLLAEGRIQWSARAAELHSGPGFHLWARIRPGGRIVNVTRETGSFVADVDGELELGVYLGMWADAYGTLDTPPAAYARLQGELTVLVLRWSDGDAVMGLAPLARAVPHALLAQECARLARPDPTPPGWHYRFETGTSDIWRLCGRPDERRICLDARDDQGIICHPLDWPLGPATELSWRWRLDAQPSAVAEHTTRTHDYVSIALEFADGRDLTWLWSVSLPPGTWFACPIQAWSARETHWVVRSGTADLGRWVSERRRVQDDVGQALGGDPGRITAVWLIAVTTFQHGTARATFADIRLRDAERELRVL